VSQTCPWVSTDIKNIFFANFYDVLYDKIDKTFCIKNKSVCEKYNYFCLPNSVISSLIIKKSKISGIFSDWASDILQSQENVVSKFNKIF